MANEKGAAVPEPQVLLSGVAGWDPTFPKVNESISYYWSETNFGGAHPDVYHARVKWTGPNGIIDDISVECPPLQTNQEAQRFTTLSAPTVAGMEYSIELWVDIDHWGDRYNETNSAYHSVTVDD